MRKKLPLLTGMGLLFFLLNPCLAQTVEDFAVKATVETQISPPAIKISFPKDLTANSYSIFKKQPGSNSWGTVQVTLGSSDSNWTDNNVQLGKVYEYKVQKNKGSITALAYLHAGIQIPAVHHRGKLILVTDSLVYDSLQAELSILKMDLLGDGWDVSMLSVSRTASPVNVKAAIKAIYDQDPDRTKALFLLGHVPVPYSGGFGTPGDFSVAPDAHPDHVGAWPADVYYGEFNGTWDDVNINNTSGSRVKNQNIPGDGKFDRATLYGDVVTLSTYDSVKLQIGRVDLANMPAFGSSEIELLRKYLQKDHRFRTKEITAAEKAVIDDNFGVMGGEVFAASGWRAFTAMFGAGNITTGDYFTTLGTESMLWAYGCGGGSYTSCSGVGNTSNFVNDTAQAVFNMLFGSYFGDWDSDNNFLRAPLASGTHGLISAWSGRPHWQFFPMALGQTAGYCAQLTQNNNGGTTNTPLYAANNFWSGIHVALMGDPTLRMHIIRPVITLNATLGSGNNTVNLNWTASADAALGYYIYRQATNNGPFELITPSPVTSLTYTDTDPWNGSNTYMIRAAKLQVSASGSYENLSQGTFTTIPGVISNKYPAGMPVAANTTLEVYPNPATDQFILKGSHTVGSGSFRLSDMSGKTILTGPINNNTEDNTTLIDVSGISNGLYIVEVEQNGVIAQKKLLVQHL